MIVSSPTLLSKTRSGRLYKASSCFVSSGVGVVVVVSGVMSMPISDGAVGDSAGGTCTPVNAVIDGTDTGATLFLILQEAGTPISALVTGTPVNEDVVSDSASGSCTPVNAVVDDTETWVSLLLLLLKAGTPISVVDTFIVTVDAASGDVSDELAHCAARRSGVGPLRFGG